MHEGTEGSWLFQKQQKNWQFSGKNFWLKKVFFFWVKFFQNQGSMLIPGFFNFILLCQVTKRPMAGWGKSFFPVIFNEIPSGYNGKTKDKMTQGIF